MRIIIRFKSGFELPITCESYSIVTHPITGEIDRYTIKRIKDNKPVFFRSVDIECIFQDLTAEGEDNGQKMRKL